MTVADPRHPSSPTSPLGSARPPTPSAARSPAGPGELARTLAAVRRSPGTVVGLSLIALHVAVALAAPLIAPFSPTANDASAVLSGSSGRHLLGTDQLGRDILSRVLFGGRFSLTLAVISALLAVGLGTVLGCLAAYDRSWFDEVLMRVIDAVLSVPTILALLVVVSMLGTGAPVIAAAATVIYAPAVTRVVRAGALQVIELDYVIAARSRGERVWAIIGREVLPNIIDIVFIELAMRASWILLLISSLSFLGFGANPPTPDWGLMVSENRTLMGVLPAGTIAPIVALATLIIGFNLTADGFAKIRGVDRILGGHR